MSKKERKLCLFQLPLLDLFCVTRNLENMAVYTHLNHEQINGYLAEYNLGTLASFEGIEQGVSNTNYKLYTEQGHFILTLFEPHRVDEKTIPFFLSYAGMLAEAKIPSARPISRNDGSLFGSLAKRPAVIMSYCEGEHLSEVKADHCFAVGKLLANMHLASDAFELTQKNQYSKTKWKQWISELDEGLNDISFGLHAALVSELDYLQRNWPSELPIGSIHADLFPDNVFFIDDEVTGLIDFHFACNDFLAYDLAIVICAWCFDNQNQFSQQRYESLLSGYNEVRPLNELEVEALPTLLRGAAFRFVLSRAEEVLAHKPGDLNTPHDPVIFINRLELLQHELVNH